MATIAEMTITPKRLALPLICVLCLLASCSSGVPADQNTPASQTNSANAPGNTEKTKTNDDLSELALVIRMPDIYPEDVSWREEEMQPPQGKKLTAVFSLSDEDAARLISSAEKVRPAERVQMDAAQWFPAELIAQAPLSGDNMLKGSSYAATDFVNAPYSKGRVVRIDNTNYFILELN